MPRGFDEDEYRSLLVAYPPRPISEESELPEVEEHIWELLAIDERSPAQEAYLTLLRDLVQQLIDLFNCLFGWWWSGTKLHT